MVTFEQPPKLGTRIQIGSRAYKVESLNHQVLGNGLERCVLVLVYQELPPAILQAWTGSETGTDIGPEPTP